MHPPAPHARLHRCNSLVRSAHQSAAGPEALLDVNSFMFFAAVVDAGSFVNAARRLGIDRSNVSRRIRNLEREVGAQLLRRTTRRMELTETGALFYERCAVIDAEVQNAQKALLNLRSSVRGPLSLSCPPMLGREFLAPLLAAFCSRYPEVNLRVTLKTNVNDLIGEGIDVALRLSDQPGPNTVARQLARVDWVVCASPRYLRERGTPAVPEDLAGHVWLGQRGRMALEMVRGSEHRRVSVVSRLECPDFTFLREALVAGLGVGLMPAYIAADAIRRGRLRAVLGDFRLSPSPGDRLYAITLATRYTPPQVRALLDFLTGSFETGAVWELDRPGAATRSGRARSARTPPPARRAGDRRGSLP